MKIIFFILTHKNPEQTVRLIQRLESPASRFVIHVDRRQPLSVYTVISRWAAKRDDIILVRRHRCYWGDFGIVAATLECVRAALRSWDDFDYGVLLSGQDYPIKPLKFIFDYLTLNSGKQFIESFSLDDTENRWTRQGGQFQATARHSWYIVRFRSRRLPIPLRRRVPTGFKACGGSQWWSLSYEALVYITEYLDNNPKIVRFFRDLSIPDETIFQTLLYRSSFQKDVISDDLHYAVWDRPTPPYPRILDDSDLEPIRSSSKLFARKFDIYTDSRILDLIDKEIIAPITSRTRNVDPLARNRGGDISEVSLL